MFGDLAVTHPHDIHRLELDLAASWRDAQKFSSVSAVISFVGRHAITIGGLPMDLGMKVGKRVPQHFVEVPRAVLVGRAARLRRVVEKIIGEQFLEQFEVSRRLAPPQCCGEPRLLLRRLWPSPPHLKSCSS